MVSTNPHKMVPPQNVFIAGLASGIGEELSARFLRHGCSVAGTARNPGKAVKSPKKPFTINCDLMETASLARAALAYHRHEPEGWDLYISSIGKLEPIGLFFETNWKKWVDSVFVNCVQQLGLLRAMYPYRKKGRMNHVAFFAGAGTNAPAPQYSAYCASKILLIKMCENLHAENPDLNVFIIGPGIVDTKIHKQTLRAGRRAGGNLQKVRAILRSKNKMVSHDQIFACLSWCMEVGREVVGGRNISLVGDTWAKDGGLLARKLLKNKDAFRLRRYHNDL